MPLKQTLMVFESLFYHKGLLGVLPAVFGIVQKAKASILAGEDAVIGFMQATAEISEVEMMTALTNSSFHVSPALALQIRNKAREQIAKDSVTAEDGLTDLLTFTQLQVETLRLFKSVFLAKTQRNRCAVYILALRQILQTYNCPIARAEGDVISERLMELYDHSNKLNTASQETKRGKNKVVRSLNFYECTSLLLVLMESGTSEREADKLRLCFDVFDSDGTGFLDNTQLMNITNVLCALIFSEDGSPDRMPASPRQEALARCRSTIIARSLEETSKRTANTASPISVETSVHGNNEKMSDLVEVNQDTPKHEKLVGLQEETSESRTLTEHLAEHSCSTGFELILEESEILDTKIFNEASNAFLGMTAELIVDTIVAFHGVFDVFVQNHLVQVFQALCDRWKTQSVSTQDSNIMIETDMQTKPKTAEEPAPQIAFDFPKHWDEYSKVADICMNALCIRKEKLKDRLSGTLAAPKQQTAELELAAVRQHLFQVNEMKGTMLRAHEEFKHALNRAACFLNEPFVHNQAVREGETHQSTAEVATKNSTPPCTPLAKAPSPSRLQRVRRSFQRSTSKSSKKNEEKDTTQGLLLSDDYRVVHTYILQNLLRYDRSENGKFSFAEYMHACTESKHISMLIITIFSADYVTVVSHSEKPEKKSSSVEKKSTFGRMFPFSRSSSRSSPRTFSSRSSPRTFFSRKQSRSPREQYPIQ
jgi:hypothetical protein